MISQILLSVLIAQPKLEFGSFQEFSATLVEGSGYRVVVDRFIGGRPVVWHFGGWRGSGLETLKRGCDELYLQCSFDEPTKRILVTGPTEAAGMTHEQRWRESFQLMQKQVQELQRLPEKELKEFVDGYEEAQKLIDNPIERMIYEQKVHKAMEMLQPGKKMMLGILSQQEAGDLARKLLVGYTSKTRIELSASQKKMVFDYLQSDEYGESLKPGPGVSQKDINEINANRNGFTPNGFEAWIRHSKLDSIGLFQLVVRQGNKTIDPVVNMYLGADSWRGGEVKPEYPEVAGELLNWSPVVKDQVLWGYRSLNAWQSWAIEHHLNTVWWLDSAWSWPRSRTEVRQNIEDLMHLEVTKDGWLRVHNRRNRYPLLSGDWRGVERLYDNLNPTGAEPEDVLRVLEAMPDDELDGMQLVSHLDAWGLEHSQVMDYVHDIVRNPRMVRAGLREFIANGKQRTMKQVKFLQGASNVDIARGWFGALSDTTDSPYLRDRRGDYTLFVDQIPFVFSDTENGMEAGERECIILMLFFKEGDKLLDRIGPVRIFLPKKEGESRNMR